MADPQIRQEAGTEATQIGLVHGSVTIINLPPSAPAEAGPEAESGPEQKPIPPNPYRGLFAFRPEHAPLFFGRETFTAQLVAAVERRRLVTVLGASGSGKSSVVFAGLVPELVNRPGEPWLFSTFRPGDDPFQNLAAALVPLYEETASKTARLGATRDLAASLRRGRYPLSDVLGLIRETHPDQRLLLIADQFEELYTLCPDPDARRAFLDLLLSTLPDPRSPLTIDNLPLTIALTLRADFLSQASLYRPLADALQGSTELLGPMTRTEMTAAIEKPADLRGVSFEANLVERLLEDVGEEEGSLPLLEFALSELWRRQQARTLTHAAYEEIGQVKGALSRHADRAYRRLSPPEQEQARRVFVQLVTPGRGTEDTRRLATRRELGQNWALVAKLASERLVVTGRRAGDGEADPAETVEVVHEALIRNWGQLRRWLEADREFLTWRLGLRADLERWEETGRDEGALLRGAPLAVAGDWLEKRAADLTKPERAYIQASLAEQERRAKQATRRRNLTLTTALAVIVVLAGLAFWALLQRNEAERQSQVALAQSLAALAPRTNNDTELTTLLAIEALHLNQPAAEWLIDSALREVLFQHPVYNNTFSGHEDWVRSVAFSPDGQTLASGSADRSIRLWNLAEPGAEPVVLSGHEDWVRSVAFSPDGQTLASGSADRSIRLWNLAEPGAEPVVLSGHESRVLSVAFSPDGQTLASGSADRSIRLWNLAEPGAEPVVLSGHESRVLSVAFSPDGQTLASGSDDRSIRLWNLAEPGAEPVVLSGHESSVRSVAFSPDGQTLASGSDDRSIRLWNLAEPGAEPVVLSGHESRVLSVAFSPDGQTLASGSADRSIRLWNLAEPGAEPVVLSGHEDWVLSVAFSPDGQTLASGSADRSIRLWNLAEPGAEPVVLSGHEDWVLSVAFSPDGQTLASGSADRSIRLWNLAEPGAEPVVLSGHESSVRSVAFSPDGQTLASGSDDRSIRLWNLAEPGAEPVVLSGHESSVRSVAFSPDGQTLASGSADRSIRLWNLAEPGAEPVVLSGHESRVLSVAFSPDGQTLASGSDDRSIRLWNLAEPGAEPVVLSGHESRVLSVAFSPDGQTLASGSDDRSIRLWNLAEPGAEPVVLSGHESRVLSVAFSPDGQTLASGSDDRSIRLWNLAEPGAEPVVLSGHDFRVLSVAFGPDGQTLASGSADRSIRLWNLAEPGAEPVVLSGHESRVLSVAFSPDGQTLASGSADRSIRLWRVQLDKFASMGCRKVRRNLSLAEWRRYMPLDTPYHRTCANLPSGFGAPRMPPPPILRYPVRAN